MKLRDSHQVGISTSTALGAYYVKDFIPPLEVVRILNNASVRFMLVGAHGLAGWLEEVRLTQDVDVLAAYRQEKKAVRALLAEFPDLEAEDQEVVIRLRNPETGKVLIDVMKVNQPLFREGFKHHHQVNAEGQTYFIPTVEMALAMKFAPMTSLVRSDEKKLQDVIDFRSLVKQHPEINLETLERLGELVYPGGGKEILELVRKIRAGERIQI